MLKSCRVRPDKRWCAKTKPPGKRPRNCRCKPSEAECAFAYIGPGSEYVFTEEDGDTYTIKIDEIRKVKVGASAKSSAKGAKAHASVGPNRRFVPPILADLVVVASDRLQNSNNDPESR